MNNEALGISQNLRTLLHQKSIPSDLFIDQIIGIEPNHFEKKLGINELVETYGSAHRTYRADTAYSYIFKMYEYLASFKPKSLLDIGSGNGRILFFGALMFPEVNYHGIELVKERANFTKHLQQKLNLNIKIQNGDVLKEDLPHVECICLINSLFPDMMPPLMNRLKSNAKERSFLLISASTCNTIISQQDWIKEIDLNPAPRDEYDLRIFQTI